MISYTHVIAVDGWYISASIGLNASIQVVKDWANYGLGRHIETYAHNLEEVWEGLVNEIVIEIGDVSYTIGPLLEIENDPRIKYTEAATQIASETLPLIDFDSQARYGQRISILTEGTISDAIADSIQQSRLNEYKHPKKRRDVSMGKGNAMSVTLNCIGYNVLANYPYTRSATNPDDKINASDKLIHVFQNSPDSLYQVDTGEIEFNDTQVLQLEDKDRLASAIISEVVKYGSVDNRRMIWGVGNGRVPFYRQIPTPNQVDYHARIFAGQLSVREQPYPWLVKPGRFVQYDDASAIFEAVPNETVDEDPGKEFIESVTYTAPWGLDFGEGYAGTLAQQVAALGLMGE